MNIVKYAVAVLVLTSASGIAQMEPPKPERNSVKEGKEQPKHERMGERKGMEARGDRMEMLLEQLSNNQKLMEETGITEEQITKIKDSLDEIKKKLIDLRGEMEKAGMDQHAVFQAIAQAMLDHFAEIATLVEVGLDGLFSHRKNAVLKPHVFTEHAEMF